MTNKKPNYPSIKEAEARRSELVESQASIHAALAKMRRPGGRFDSGKRAGLTERQATIQSELTALNAWLKEARRAAGVAGSTGEAGSDILARVRLDLNRLADMLREQQDTIGALRVENEALRAQLVSAGVTADGHDGWRDH